MKKLSPANTPSNLKTSRQNIDEIGRTSQGAPQKQISARGKKFIADAKKRKAKKPSYGLKDAMKECCK